MEDHKLDERSLSSSDVTAVISHFPRDYGVQFLKDLFKKPSTGQWRFTHFNEKNGQIKGVGWLLDNTQLYNFNIYQVKTCITVELISRRKVKFFCHQDRVTDLLNKIFYKKTKST